MGKTTKIVDATPAAVQAAIVASVASPEIVAVPTWLEQISTVFAPFVAKYSVHSVRMDLLPVKSVCYLAQYGLSKSLQDSVSGLTGQILGTGKSGNWTVDDCKAGCKEIGLDDAVTTRGELAKAYVPKVMAKRFAAILAGTVGETKAGVPRATREETIRKEVILARLQAKADELKKSLPKVGTDVYKALSAKHYANFKSAIDAEVNRRMASQVPELTDSEIDELAS